MGKEAPLKRDGQDSPDSRESRGSPPLRAPVHPGAGKQ